MAPSGHAAHPRSRRPLGVHQEAKAPTGSTRPEMSGGARAEAQSYEEKVARRVVVRPAAGGSVAAAPPRPTGAGDPRYSVAGMRQTWGAQETPVADSKRGRAEDESGEDADKVTTVDDSLLSMSSPSMMKKPRVEALTPSAEAAAQALLESPLTGWTEVSVTSPITPGLGNSMSSMTLAAPRRTPAGEYARFIVKNWLLTEKDRTPVRPDYLDWQEDLSAEIRSDGVGFLVDMSLHLGLQCETIHVAVMVLDATLTKYKLVKSRLKQVLLASLRIAAKYEELIPPCLVDYAKIIRTPVDREQVQQQQQQHQLSLRSLQQQQQQPIHDPPGHSILPSTNPPEQMTGMEMVILNALHFDITFPSTLVYAMGWLAHTGLEKDHLLKHMIMYVLEVCLADYYILQYTNADVAASSVVTAWTLAGRPGRPSLQWHWERSIHGIQPCLKRVWNNVTDLCNGGMGYAGRVIQKKYSHENVDCVSPMAESALRRGVAAPF